MIVVAHVIYALLMKRPTSPIGLLMVNIPIGLYVLWAKFYARGYHRILSRYAESTYFLGYVATVGALAVVAVDIAHYKNPLDFLPEILLKGGGAITSTVVGLMGMFWLRVEVQVLEDSEMSGDAAAAIETKLKDKSEEVLHLLTEKSEKMAQALDALLQQFQSNETKARQSISEFVRELGESLEEVGANARKVATGLDSFDRAVAHSGESLKIIQGVSESLARTATQSQAASERVSVSWEKIEHNVASVDKLMVAITATALPISDTATALETCGKKAADMAEAIGRAHQEINTHIAILRQRTSEVGSLAEGVKTFTTAANLTETTIGRIQNGLAAMQTSLNEVVRTQEGMKQLNQSVSDTNGSFRLFDQQLVAASNRNAHLSKTSEALVEELLNRVGELKTLMVPLEELGREMERLRPRLQPLAGDGRIISEITTAVGRLEAQIARVQSVTGTLVESADGASTKIKEFVHVVRDFVQTEAEMEALRRKSRR